MPVPRSLLDQLALLPAGGEVDWTGEQMPSLLSSLAAFGGPNDHPGVPVTAREPENHR